MEKILLVDDEQSVLDGFHRQLRKKFNIETATSGHDGLRKIVAEGPFAVIISDMRMPIMDGIAFLMEVRKIAPESVRMMLTGNADQQTAIDAINRGAIFRFLTKHCSTENLTGALMQGLNNIDLLRRKRNFWKKLSMAALTFSQIFFLWPTPSRLANPCVFENMPFKLHVN